MQVIVCNNWVGWCQTSICVDAIVTCTESSRKTVKELQLENSITKFFRQYSLIYLIAMCFHIALVATEFGQLIIGGQI